MKRQKNTRGTSGNGLISQKSRTRLVGKRTVTIQTVRRRRINLLDLPLDVIIEILGRVEPLDLLRVLETSKAFTNLLTGPSSRVIWKGARANISGLPECPDDLNEVAYARLAFESHCQVCDQGRSYDLRVVRVWAARARYCSDCFDANFVPKQTGRRDKKAYPDTLKELLPTRLGWHHHPVICRSLNELWDKEYKILKTDEERHKWTDTKIAERKKINEHARLCAKWYDSWEREKAERRERQVEDRKERIMNRLEELGWSHEIRTNPYCNELLADRRVRRACQQELMGKALDGVVNYLVDYLEQAKERRLAESFQR